MLTRENNGSGGLGKQSMAFKGDSVFFGPGFSDRLGREEAASGLAFRAVEPDDIAKIDPIMSFWLKEFHVKQGQPPEKLRMLEEVYVRNMQLLEACARGERPGHHFYVGVDTQNDVIGTAGFVTNEHMDPNLRRVTQQIGIMSLPNGPLLNLTDPNAAELYFLYTDPNKKIEGINSGRYMMNGIIAEALQLTGCNWSVFSSREVWRKTGWKFHDRQPDFYLINPDINPNEPGTRAYVVNNVYQAGNDTGNMV